MKRTFIWRFNITRKEWDKLTQEQKNAVKAYLFEGFKNAITVESFENAKKQLLKIRKWGEKI